MSEEKVKGVGINKKAWVIAVGLAVGLGFIIWGNGVSSDGGKSEVREEVSEISYTDKMEEKLETFLGSIDGIEDVNVFLTYDGGNEYEYAEKGKNGEGATDYLIIKNGDGEEAVTVKEIYPRIRGVAISCTGGNSPAVKERITESVSAALGIPTSKICVVGT